MSTFFAAARTDDDQLFESVTTTDFYAYDGGIRLGGHALMDMLKSLRATGKRYTGT